MKDQRLDRIRSFLRARDWAGLFCELEYPVRPAGIPASALAAWGWRGDPVRGVSNLVATPGLRINLVEEVEWATCRALALSVARQNPTVCVFWIWAEGDHATFAIVDHRDDGRPFLRKMTVDCETANGVAVEQLCALARSHAAGPAGEEHGESMRKHLVEVLDQEGLTREFFRGFRDRLELLCTRMEGGPIDARSRHEMSLVVLLRLVFLCFLQREGLLDGDRRFLARHLRDADACGKSFWDNVLRPLFFGVLNTEVAQRSEQAAELGEIPFLNGGLFEPNDVELGSEAPSWGNDVWTEIIDRFFERYHFVTTEPETDDEVRVVDPEMLGKVFEGLMYGDDRLRAGAFYTPRDVVRGMVERTLTARLTAVSELSATDLGGDDPFEERARQEVVEALEDFTILDPAVGTGAFLLEALHVLRRWHKRAGLPVGWAGTRDIIHHHLYGVDVEHTAVRICELRLWLAMLATGVASGEPLPPLPNLSHRIVAGDSLVEPADLGRLVDAMGRGFVGGECDGKRRALEARLDDLQGSFLRAHGSEKRDIRRELAAVEAELQTQVLQGRRARLLQLIEPLDSVESSVDLFGHPVATSAQRLGARALRSKLATVDRALRNLAQDRTSAVFAYESRFGDAARRGFDVVLTNPPWVRATRLDREVKQFLGARYRAADNSLWPGAQELGIRTPFGTQQDLSALFLERSLELLRPGGLLCALVPSKLFRSLHGASLRNVLGEHCVERVEDLSDSDRELFEATTYPAIVTIRKAAPEPEHSFEAAVWRGGTVHAFRGRQREVGALSGCVAEPWLLVSPHLREVFGRMYERSIPLGAIEGFAPTRGIFTGANELFIRRAGELEEAFGPECQPWIRPVLTGASLGEGEAMEILWGYDRSGAVRDDLPDPMRCWFAAHEDHLSRRADRDERLPPWQVFRVKQHTLGPKVAWRDIAPWLEAELVDPDAVPLNTVYYLPCPDEEVAAVVAAWMNSLPVRALARELAERARGGWRRHFAWVVRMLPVPKTVAASGFRLLEPMDEAFGLSTADVAHLEGTLFDGGLGRKEAA